MTSTAEDRPKQRRERRAGLRAVDPADPAGSGRAPWSGPKAASGPDPAGADPEADDPDHEHDPGRRGDSKGRRRRRRRRRDRAEEPLVPAPLAARARPRHWGALAGFLLLVVLPFVAATAYLFTRAADQYHADVAFSVRSEEVGSAASAGILGALTQIGGGGAPDAAILYEYIRSQEIVAAVDARLDLRTMWNLSLIHI